MRARRLIASILAAAFLAMPQAALAALRIYYDPLTGNVALDTSGTRSGALFVYALTLSPAESNLFRPEKHIRLTSSTFYESTTRTLFEGAVSGSITGLFTIGDVLPSGLSESAWASMFATRYAGGAVPDSGFHMYTDVIGGGFPPPAEFHYGRPAGEFNNRLGLIDPDQVTWAAAADLVYDPRTGAVKIVTDVTNGGYISGVMLESAGRFAISGLATQLLEGPFDSFDANHIFKVADFIEPGTLALGHILPQGLSLQELRTLLTTAKFFGRAGFEPVNLDFTAAGTPLSVTIAAVPEPSAYAIAALAILSSAGFRRRFAC